MSLAAAIAEHRQTVQALSTPVTAEALTQAYFRNSAHARQLGLYRDSAERKTWRTLLNACRCMPNMCAVVTFLKKHGELRTMVCRPTEDDIDGTLRYFLVWDLEAEDYRRINLDAIVKVTIESHSA